jgi:formyltetrahydrofolate hydrolase
MSKDQHLILRIECNERTGLLYNILKDLFEFNWNIIENQEFFSE